MRENLVLACKKELRKTVIGVTYSEKDWEQGWEKLLEDGIYEVEFADFMIYGWWKFVNMKRSIICVTLPGIAHVLKKNIIIFHVGNDVKDPISIVRPDLITGGEADIRTGE